MILIYSYLIFYNILKGAADNAERLSFFVLVTRGAIPPFQLFSHNRLKISRKKKTPA